MDGTQRIELQLDDLKQLFNSREDMPFRGKGLNADAAEFIESAAANGAAGALLLVVHLPGALPGPEVEQRLSDAVHAHFTDCQRTSRLSFQRLMAEGRRTLLVGLSFLALCLLLGAQVFPEGKPGPLNAVLHESFVIAGWVALWRPLEICLYDWWPLRKRGKLLGELGRMRVELRARASQPAA